MTDANKNVTGHLAEKVPVLVEVINTNISNIDLLDPCLRFVTLLLLTWKSSSCVLFKSLVRYVREIWPCRMSCKVFPPCLGPFGLL